MREIKVSVICLAYNHEAYIRDALEGFVMQQTDFAYEVLVQDDASTDRTAQIIREYEKKYPDLIRPVYQRENQRSQRADMMEAFLYPKVRGKYIALCEGDDYWTSPHKLQRQYDALEQHPEVDICAHASWILYADGKKEISICAAEDALLRTEQVIAGGGSYVNTNTLMYRAALNRCIPGFRKKFDYDYTLQIHGSLRAGMYYLREPMSVYRACTADSWSDRVSRNVQAKIKHHREMLKMLDCFNCDTNHRYREPVEQAQYIYKRGLAFLEKDISWIREERLYKESGLRSRISFWLGCRLPGFHKKMIGIYCFFLKRKCGTKNRKVNGS